MKVLQMNISRSRSTVPDWSYSKLFSKEETALEYLSSHFPGNEETTEEIQKEQYWRDDVPRTFIHTKAQYDSDGEYDYPIESVITFEWVEVI